MDKLKIFFAVSLLASFSFGCEIGWNHSLASAKKASATSKKPIMVFVTSMTCPYCTIMSETALADEDVCGLVTAKFIPLVVIGNSDEMPKKSRVMGVPAVLFVDAAENEIAARVVGVRSAKDFLNDLKQRTQR